MAISLLLLLVGGCANWSDLSFRVDKRLHFKSPASRTLVTVPFRVSWTMRDFDLAAPGSAPATRDAGYFAVFIDRSPVAPGHRVEEIAKNDRACRTLPGCPDKQYLADRGIFTTTEPTVEITRVNALPGKDEVQLHLLYVVLMDASGHRIGEISYRLEFKSRQKATAH